MEIKLNKNYFYLLIIILLSIFGSLFIAWCTRNGPWGGTDSIAYLVSARNIIKGIGIGYYFPDGSFYTQTIQAPLYPMVLALIGIFNIDLITGAQILNIVLFGGTIFTAGFIFYRFSSHPWLSIIVCFILGTFPVFLQMYTQVMTEALFFFLYFLGLFFLLGYLKQYRTGWLITSGVMMGLLFVTRYIGLVLIPTSIITIMLFLRINWWLRLKAVLIFGLMTIIPICIWGVYLVFTNNIAQVKMSGISWNLILSRFADFRANSLPFVWKWIPFQNYISGLKSRSQFIIILAIICSIVLITYFARQWSKKKFEYSANIQEYHLFFIFGCSGVSLLVFMIFSYIFFNLPAKMDNRQFLPIFISCALSIVSALAFCISVLLKNTKPWKAITAWGFILVLLLSVYIQFYKSINFINLDQGLISRSWEDSEIVHAVRQISPAIQIVSNNPAALLYWADRPAYDMLESLTPQFVIETIPYGSDLTDRAQKVFHDSKGILVVFNNFPTQMSDYFFEKGSNRLKTIFSGLNILETYHDGTIYTFGSATTP